jgi:hypothetical protein
MAQVWASRNLDARLQKEASRFAIPPVLLLYRRRGCRNAHGLEQRKAAASTPPGQVRSHLAQTPCGSQSVVPRSRERSNRPRA